MQEQTLSAKLKLPTLSPPTVLWENRECSEPQEKNCGSSQSKIILQKVASTEWKEISMPTCFKCKELGDFSTEYNKQSNFVKNVFWLIKNDDMKKVQIICEVCDPIDIFEGVNK